MARAQFSYGGVVHTHTRTHAHARVHARARARTRTHTHARRRAHARACAWAHTHTQVSYGDDVEEALSATLHSEEEEEELRAQLGVDLNTAPPADPILKVVRG